MSGIDYKRNLITFIAWVVGIKITLIYVRALLYSGEILEYSSVTNLQLEIVSAVQWFNKTFIFLFEFISLSRSLFFFSDSARNEPVQTSVS